MTLLFCCGGHKTDMPNALTNVRLRDKQTSALVPGMSALLDSQSSTAPPVALITLEVIMRALSDATKATARAVS